jgi:hypothetical protein
MAADMNFFERVPCSSYTKSGAKLVIGLDGQLLKKAAQLFKFCCWLHRNGRNLTQVFFDLSIFFGVLFV